MRPPGRIITIVCSDIHLSLRPPAARAGEPDWLFAMLRTIEELKSVALLHDAPILCAGDIFHYWKAEPELINWAIENMPTIYAIPGQHDLPLHNIDNIKRSAYWTLVEAGTIRENLSEPVFTKKLCIYPFPWNATLKPSEEKQGTTTIALIHRYVWWGEHKYPMAPAGAHLGKIQKILASYDVCVFGDNHKGFLTTIGKNNTTIFNCGGFMRRASDEINYRPMVGLLHDTGRIDPHYLDTSKEVMEPVAIAEPVNKENEKIREFVASLNRAGSEAGLDFEKAVRLYLENENVSEGTRRAVLEALE